MTGTEVAQFDWAKYAAEAAKAAPVSGAKSLSCKGGVFALGDTVLGTELAVIVLDSIWLNTFYRGKWTEGSKDPPICYAYGRSDAEMTPHHTMQSDMTWFQPQSPWNVDRPAPCSLCPKNEWGSAETGKGKACQNRERLAIIPAGQYVPRRGSRDTDLHLHEDPAYFADAEVVKFNLPVTSMSKHWRPYVQKVVGQYQRPPFGVITRMYVEPDPVSQYLVKFEAVEPIGDHLVSVIMARHQAARATMEEAFSAPDRDVPGARR